MRRLSRHIRGKKHISAHAQALTVDQASLALVEAAKRNPGPHIAFLGPTFGEFRMMQALGDRLARRLPDAGFTYCLRHAPSIETVRRQFPDLPVAIMPSENLDSVLDWLRQVEPDIVVFMESSQPLIALAARAFGAKTVLANGRFRNRPKRQNWHRSYSLRQRSGAYDLILFQNEEHYQNAREWAPPSTKLVITGDIKIDLTAANLANPNAELERWLEPAESPILIAGSTDVIEEDRMVIEAFQEVSRQAKCRLLIAPRNIARAEEIQELARQRGFVCSRRTFPSPQAQVLILDTLGELASVYRFGTAAYVGGAFHEGGKGHNVLEPLEWGVPVSYGMQRGHFGDQQRLCESAGVGTRISSQHELATSWLNLLQNPEERDQLGNKAKSLIDQNRGAIDRAADEIVHLANLASATNP